MTPEQLDHLGSVNRQIMEMVNEHSPIVRKLRISDVSNSWYVSIEADEKVVACVEVHRVSWYQAEIRHLVVLPDYRRHGLGSDVLAKACSEAREAGLKVAQCTIRTDNYPSLSLFALDGFTSTLQFQGLSGNTVSLWQKLL